MKKKAPITASDVHIIVSPKPDEVNDSAKRLLARGRGSLGFFLGEPETRGHLLTRGLRWQQVILAMHGKRAVGFAAFKRRGRGGPYSPNFLDFLEVHGWSALWRYLAFWLAEARDLRAGFYLYGVRVNKRYRGLGVAKALLDAVQGEARKFGANYIELEVTESHPRAQDVYQRYGFVVKKVRALGWLARFFKFTRVTTMRLPLD